jgi:LysR family transcriptional regulator, regulator for bpeEF and oprC
MAIGFLTDMAMFVEVVNARNFGRAARKLGVSPSLISRRIRTMEQELGVSLIQRSTRSFALTDAGAACYERSRKVVSEAEKIRADIGSQAIYSAGHVRVGAPFDLLQTLLIPIFSQFVRSTPAASIEITTIHGYPSPISAGLDLAMFVAHQKRLPDSSFSARRVGTFRRELYASNEYLKRRGVPKEPEDLTQHDCILFSLGDVQRKWELRRGRERRIVDVRGICSAGSGGLTAQLAREHLGIATCAGFHGSGLVRVLPEWEAVPANVFAVTPVEIIPVRIRKLIELMRARFEESMARAKL